MCFLKAKIILLTIVKVNSTINTVNTDKEIFIMKKLFVLIGAALAFLALLVSTNRYGKKRKNKED